MRIPDAAQRLDAYPHQFSGGMRQRVAIAIALLHRPALIVCDEPTTALDVSIQAQILTEMRGLVRDLGMALIWISHDLATVSSLASRILVMYAGRIIEEGRPPRCCAVRAIPTRRGLAQSLPSRAEPGRDLAQIPGSTPSLLRLPEGCSFRPRCGEKTDACLRMPEIERHGARAFRCHHPLVTPKVAMSALVDVHGRLEAVRAAPLARREDRGIARQRDRDAHRARARPRLARHRSPGEVTRTGRRIRLRKVHARPRHRRHPAAEHRDGAHRRRAGDGRRPRPQAHDAGADGVPGPVRLARSAHAGRRQRSPKGRSRTGW